MPPVPMLVERVEDRGRWKDAGSAVPVPGRHAVMSVNVHALQIQRNPAPQDTEGKYKVANWPEYDAALVRRGSLTVWVIDEANAAWHAPATGKCGGQPTYS